MVAAGYQIDDSDQIGEGVHPGSNRARLIQHRRSRAISAGWRRNRWRCSLAVAVAHQS
jgi:hypothetical protein